MCAALAGARVGSNSDGCAVSTNGRSGCCPFNTSVLRLCNLIECSAEMHGNRAPALCRSPRHRLRQRIVNLEDSRPRLKPLHQTAKTRCEAIAGNGNKLSRRRIK